MDVGIQGPQRFDHTCCIRKVIQVVMYVIELCVYMCMYLLQATSRPPSIGAQSDFFLSTNRGQERRLEPSVVAFGSAVGLLPALPHISASACRVKPDVSSAGSGLERLHQASELRAGCRNPAPRKV